MTFGGLSPNFFFIFFYFLFNYNYGCCHLSLHNSVRTRFFYSFIRLIALGSFPSAPPAPFRPRSARRRARSSSIRSSRSACVRGRCRVCGGMAAPGGRRHRRLSAFTRSRSPPSPYPPLYFPAAMSAAVEGRSRASPAASSQDRGAGAARGSAPSVHARGGTSGN